MSLPPQLDPACHTTVFHGGILGPRLDHPEGIAVDPRDGAIWCGGEGGQLYRISPDGREQQVVAETGGFLLGVTLLPDGRVATCDLAHRCVWIFPPDGGTPQRLDGCDGDERLQLPNAAAVTRDGHWLYVSDTRREGGPGVWRFDLRTGESVLWLRESCLSANGLALAPDESALYLVESHLPGVSRVPIRADGAAGPKELAVALPHDEPDGLAFSAAGELFISIYHPSRIYRWQPVTGALALIIEDATTDWLHHPTNIAFRGTDTLFCANFGAWHVTRIDLSTLAAS